MRRKSISILKVLFFTSLLGINLSGCIPFTPEKSPCDQWASGCGQKIKINQWQS